MLSQLLYLLSWKTIPATVENENKFRNNFFRSFFYLKNSFSFAPRLTEKPVP